MDFVRNKRRFGGWLALFALALQLTLSFGHIHAEDFHAQDLAPGATATVNADHGGGSSSPDHDDCPICATIFLLSTSAMPEAPMVALPADQGIVLVAQIERAHAFVAPSRPFRARAPPRA